MNKSDIKLLGVVLLVSIILFVIVKINSKDGSYALVYYENKLVEKIELNKNYKYNVEGYNGEVIVEVKNGKIGVIKETSPYHLCSKQGFTSNSLQPIICLPNKIVIKIEGKSQEIDTVVR